LTIDGPGANALAVSGNKAVEVFDVASGVTVTISGLTVEDGVGGSVGSVSYAGGINSYGSLTVIDSTISGNIGPVGAGIESQGSGKLFVSRSFVSSNTATTAGGGIANYGTGTVTDTTVSGNTSLDHGGGIHNGGTLTVSDSTVVGNHASDTYYGGGISNDNGVVTVSNSTVSGNSAAAGGGIYNIFGTTNVDNSTVSGNIGGDLYNPQGTLNTTATIVASGVSETDCVGSITDLGYNLDDDSSCNFSGTSLSDTPSGLDPAGLQNNGGPTQTIALEPVSLAIDHVTDALLCPATDQRGFPRSVPCDIGAFETQGFGIHRRRG